MIAAVASPKKEIESQLQSNIETRFIPGVCEEYIENLVKNQIEEAQIEATFEVIDAEEENKGFFHNLLFKTLLNIFRGGIKRRISIRRYFI